jgi:hypothetical protein
LAILHNRNHHSTTRKHTNTITHTEKKQTKKRSLFFSLSPFHSLSYNSFPFCYRVVTRPRDTIITLFRYCINSPQWIFLETPCFNP